MKQQYFDFERYGFAIGNVAATDMDNPEAVVAPGGTIHLQTSLLNYPTITK